MELNNLTTITKNKKRRLGQGHGSGRSKTSGRGTKGQKARRKISLTFEGGAVSLIKRLPFMRGKGRNKVFKKKPIGVNVVHLNIFKTGSKVDLQSLIDNKIVRKDQATYNGVKILGDGRLNVALTVTIPVSKGAAEKITRAGGTVENLPISKA